MSIAKSDALQFFFDASSADRADFMLACMKQLARKDVTKLAIQAHPTSPRGNPKQYAIVQRVFEGQTEEVPVADKDGFIIDFPSKRNAMLCASATAESSPDGAELRVIAVRVNDDNSKTFAPIGAYQSHGDEEPITFLPGDGLQALSSVRLSMKKHGMRLTL